MLARGKVHKHVAEGKKSDYSSGFDNAGGSD